MIIFQYELSESRSLNFRKIGVDDEASEENVHCTEGTVMGETAKDYTISKKRISDVKALIAEHEDTLKTLSFPLAPVMDGSKNNFTFRNSKGETFSKVGSNLSCFRGADCWGVSDKELREVQQFLKLFDSIAEVLIAGGVPEKYFQLDM